MLLFATISFGLLGYSHVFSRPRGAPTILECDPTDWLDAVVAASHGGLLGSFPDGTTKQQRDSDQPEWLSRNRRRPYRRAGKLKVMPEIVPATGGSTGKGPMVAVPSRRRSQSL